MTDFGNSPGVHSEHLLVVACPVCQGEVAAAGGLSGRDACCPLCASIFRVPHPPSDVDEPRADESEQPAGLAEDWGDVIGQLAPPTKPAVEEPAVEEPAVEEPAVEAIVSGPVAAVSEDASPNLEAAASSPPAAGSPATTGAELSFLVRKPLDPAAADLVFQEPVRTVLHGGEVIEIRRLSPEERRNRRFRRTLMMIVIGGSILLLIVILSLPKN